MAKKVSKQKDRNPGYRLHKASGQAVVTLNGRDHYLGKHGTPASRKKYGELIAQWWANEQRPIKPSTPAGENDDEALTVAELVQQFLQWAKGHYVKNGKQTQEPNCLHYAAKPMVEKFGVLGVNDFGPLALRAVRDMMISQGMTRNTINGFMHKVRFIFRWGVGRELVNPEVVVALDAVESLQRGRSAAKESEPVKPPPDEWFHRVLPKVPEPIRTGLIVQRYTGMRAGELLQMRPCDVDQIGVVWWYVPRSHKTEHHGMERRIALGPKSQEVLKPLFATCKPTDDAFKWRRHKSRGNKITVGGYAQALLQLCRRLKITYYRPHSLRHKRLAEVRGSLGIDAAQAVGGHSSISMTAHYAKLTDAKAEQAALASG